MQLHFRGTEFGAEIYENHRPACGFAREARARVSDLKK